MVFFFLGVDMTCASVLRTSEHLPSLSYQSDSGESKTLHFLVGINHQTQITRLATAGDTSWDLSMNIPVLHSRR